MIDPAKREAYDRDGFVVVRGMFDAGEVARYRDHFMAMRAVGPWPGDFAGVDPGSADPLRRFPRMKNMHAWDPVSREWLLCPRLREMLVALAGREPYAVQTMLYFKPPGARGQALHQDQFYLQVSPGSCIAAWLALDPCAPENGAMQMVPGSHRLPLLCTEPADTRVSFTSDAVPLPPAMPAEWILMEPGDVCFFHGHVVHGSPPNTSGRFRRALIAHYLEGTATAVGADYHPVLAMDGTEVTLAVNPGGGPCGVFVDAGGRQEVELRHPARRS